MTKNLCKGSALKKDVLKAKNKWILTLDVDISVSLKQIIIWGKKKFNEFIEQTKDSNFSYEIFICDNHSKDGTCGFLKKIEKEAPKNFRFIYNSSNLGKGESVKKCADLSKGKYVAVFDIDEYVYNDLIVADSILKKNNI